MNKKITQLQKQLVPILRNNGVKKASLFGSVVRNEDTKKSDIDLLIEYKGKKSLFDLIELEMQLSGILKRKVDVLTYQSIHPLLQKQILSEHVIIL